LEDDLYPKFDFKEAKQRTKIFRFSPKKKTKKGYNALPEKTNSNEDIEPDELLISPERKMDSTRRGELTRSSTYNGPSRRPGPSSETKSNKKSTLPLPKRLSKRDIEVRNSSSPSIELSQ